MSWGRRWLHAPRRHSDTIYRMLKIDPQDAGAGYAIAPFTVLEDDGKHWIAGAVGMWRALRPLEWCSDDVTAVILWNPRSNELRLAGEIEPSLILPDHVPARITIYGDGFAFFRAWADQRAATFECLRYAAACQRAALAEPGDSDIPGALAIGALHKLDWRSTDAAVLVAGPGVDPRELNRAVIRSARLPRVESMAA